LQTCWGADYDTDFPDAMFELVARQMYSRAIPLLLPHNGISTSQRAATSNSPPSIFLFFLPPAVVILGGGGSGGRSNGRFPGSPWCSRPSLVLLLQHWHVPRTRQNPRARFCMREGLLLAGHGFCRLKRPKPRRVPLCVLLGIVPSCRDGVLLAEVGLRLGCMDFSELSLSMDDSPVWACLLG